jgi:hypothetical protein
LILRWAVHGDERGGATRLGLDASIYSAGVYNYK